jgi:hypothetical protein
MDREERRKGIESIGQSAVARSKEGYWGDGVVRKDLNNAEAALMEGLSKAQAHEYVAARVALMNEFAKRFN